MADAYSATGAAWQAGPGRVYDRLADVLADRCPVTLDGAQVLDLGAGTGAASRAAQRRGANVIAVDLAEGMLAVDAGRRPPAAIGDATALPFASESFAVVLAAFSLNHLADPASGLREARRVLRPAGALVAVVYAADDDHPVKSAVEAAATTRGWKRDPWYAALQADAVPRLATVERASAVAATAGLRGAEVTHTNVAFPDLGPRDLVEWRLGMAQLAPFVSDLHPQERDALAEDAIARLGAKPPMLVSSLIVLTWRSAD